MIDPRHGRRVASGRRFAQALSRVFAGVWDQVGPLVRNGYAPTTTDLQRLIYRLAAPALGVEIAAGYMGTLRRARAGNRVGVPRRRGKALRFDRDLAEYPLTAAAPVQMPPRIPPTVATGVGELPEIPGLQIDWTLFRPEVRIEAERLALWLSVEVSEATRNIIREQIGEGLERGEPVSVIAERIQGEAFSPRRANLIAQTESSRAQHAGQAVAAKELGVTEWSWLASSDACDVCLSLDGKVVKIGEPFYVWPTGNPAYRVVYHAPAHPSCFCTNAEVMPE